MKKSDPLLFTPGPLTCHPEVHAAMQRDIGSRDDEFISLVSSIQTRLLEIGEANSSYTTVPMQGSGTFGIESAITTLIGKDDKLLVLENGAYGKRITQIAHRAGLDCQTYEVSPVEVHDSEKLKTLLREDPAISHVAMVHCETTTGILNPLEELANIVKSEQRILIVDAMSSFGGIPIAIGELELDCLVSSANKCLEGVPGFSFSIVKESILASRAGNSSTLSLDLHDQRQSLEKTGQFRFTPPTHAFLAFDKALDLLESEGGVEGRHQRYRENHRALIDGMSGLGLTALVNAEQQSPIITSFPYPESTPPFVFEPFYQYLVEKGFAIYPGKLAGIDAFRIGTIGQIFPKDIAALLKAISEWK